MIGLDLFVVLYRRQISESETLNSLINIDLSDIGFSAKVYIWDNSPNLDVSSQYCLPDNWHYQHSTNNTSLSKVYNKLFKNSTQPYIIILDQDSILSESLFSKLRDTIRNTSADIYAPVIEHCGSIISPGKLVWIKGNHIRLLRRNATLPKNFTAMMSGLCVRRGYLENLPLPPFDERLNFYGIDTRFCRDACAHGATAHVYDAVLPHDSALRSMHTSPERLERQIWLWQSWLKVFDRNILEIIGIRFYITYKIISTHRASKNRSLLELFRKVYQ